MPSVAGQVIVITGASSGIGLATARRAARAGASVVLASRDGPLLERLAREIETDGGRALAVATDVSVEAEVEALIHKAVARFGRVDAFVNNAGVAAYSTLDALPLDEHRRIFETNYWGLVHGSLAAIRHFRSRPGGGRLVNIGSVNSDVAIPLLSAYSASKHAVKGFTDALRRELLASDPAITVTLIKPSGIATGFPQHARNHLREEPRVVPPLYAPEIVADAILDAVRHPRREIVVGAVGPALAVPLAVFPRLMDRLLAAAVPPLSKSGNPRTANDNLDTPTGEARVHYAHAPGLPFSPYTEMQKRPGLTVLLGAALVGALAARRRRRTDPFA
ncbi:SDR family oxidoreductase [Aureimonas jatrophae]|uniref:Short-chain dehydrogenase n=1 Tax=Aureimonas jatrophae TaxID=1166073 RepID=A0A1H0L6T5_9HYPH|nr:SDR family oxidoreductase [Aureimonas jatrophae]MBB3952435.1 short-subunit dehydrogenase [Aureimonas jatrophae]SDO63974.1 Short-chain dehydrogenase [Aureimonas jatrophae]